VVIAPAPDGCTLAAKRRRLVVEDERIVGDHVSQSVQDAALREIHLLLVAGREFLVE
jgi:hypothetical protein